MTTRHVRIESDGGRNSRVLVGDHDISHAVHSLTLHASATHLPVLQVELRMATVESSTDDTRVEVVMPDATRAALVALGWTPPAGES